MERTLPAARLGRRTRAARGRLPDLGPLRALVRGLVALVALLRRGVVALIAAGRRHPRWAAALLAVLAVLALAYVVVRHSPLSQVRRVQVQGVSGMDAQQIESALVAAGRRQSTLGVDVGALQGAVAHYHLVSGLHVSASFPHTLRIVATEQLPVASLRDGSQHVVVASDGAVLDPSVDAGATPTINVATLPSGHVTDPQLGAELTILGAAPPALLHRVARIYPSPNGLTVSMRNGLIIFFGDAARPHAKWISAARVIASPLAAGATYVDVRVPEDPAAGGLAADGSSAGSAGVGTDTTDASIAAALTAAIGGGTSAPASASGDTTTGDGTSAPASASGDTTTGGVTASSTTAEPTPAAQPTTAAGAATTAATPGSATDGSPAYTSTGG